MKQQGLSNQPSSKKKKAKLIKYFESLFFEHNEDHGPISLEHLLPLALDGNNGSMLALGLFPHMQIILSNDFFPLLTESNRSLAALGAFALVQSGFDASQHTRIQHDFVLFAHQVLASPDYSFDTKWYALFSACKALNLRQAETRKLFSKQFGALDWFTQPLGLPEISYEFFRKHTFLEPGSCLKSTDSRIVYFDNIPLISSGKEDTKVLFPGLPATCQSNLKQIAFKMHLSALRPILLCGEAGSGKTWTIRTLAKMLGQELIELQLDEQMDFKTLLGNMTSVVGKVGFSWLPGTLTRALFQGHWVLIEDLDAVPQEILTSLKPLFEFGSLPLPNRNSFYPLKCHPNFRLFATSRKPGYRPDRFQVVEIQQMNVEEITTIYKKQFPLLLEEVLIQIVSTNPNVGNLRDLFKWLHRVQRFVSLPTTSSKTKSETVFLTERTREAILREGLEVLFSKLPSREDRLVHARNLAVKWNLPPEFGNKLVEFPKPSFAFVQNKRRWQCGRVELSFAQSRVPLDFDQFAETSVGLKTLESLAACVELNEPALLVGETGCGKTAMISLLAKCCGKTLVVQNMHCQSDASEFVGGFKPSPNVRLEGIELHNHFLTLFTSSFDPSANSQFLMDVQRSVEQENWKRFCKACQSAAGKRNEPEWIALSQRLLEFKSKLLVNFSFVEGPLIKAVRNGDWLLLDEVNLASGETLERLLPLLEDVKSSLVLTERGDVEPIPRHPEFRLFASMNPSTDFGKKNLPEAFRTRFSEFFVDEVVEETDLTLVVATFLQPDCLDLVDPVVKIFQRARALANTSLFDGTGQVPRYSLRTLVRSLFSARALSTSQAQFAMPRAFFESFCAHFTTCLDEKCAMLLIQEACKLTENTKLHQWFQTSGVKSKEFKVSVKKNKGMQVGPYILTQGDLPPKESSRFVLTDHVKANLLLLTRAACFKKFPILLQGPTSAGKTSLISYLGACTGNRVLRINNHEHTDLQEYVGSYVSDPVTGRLVFKYGVLVEALQRGYWVILDELNLAPSEVLEALNRLLDDNRELFVVETQTLITPHPNFLLFATQNPPSYGGRKQLSRAFRNRFLEIHFGDIPYKELEQILRARDLPESFTVKMVQVMHELQLRRSKSKLFAGKWGLITPRDLLRWADRAPGSYQELAEQGYRLLGERLRTLEEREEVKLVLEQCCNVVLNLEDMYNSVSAVPEASASVVWTKSMRRVFSLVHACVLNREPVLLVGDTGLGKTKCIAAVAQFFQQPLTVLNCHQNTETADMLGSLRPCRDSKQSDRLFEWADGPLVRTMRHGEYFLIDEISLAEDAVLERLNSVLEPERTLTLAERPGQDGLMDEVVASDSFRLFATMNPGGDFGKRELSPALRNRFTEIWLPNDDALEDAALVLQNMLSVHPKATILSQRIVEFALWFNANTPHAKHVSIRDLIAWAEFVLHSTEENWEVMLAHGCFLTVLDGFGVGTTGFHASQRAEFFSLCKVKFPHFFVTSTQACLVDEVHRFGVEPFVVPRTIAGPIPFSFQSPTTQVNLMRVLRALHLPRRAILLEGSPGVGKTSLICMLAKALGKNICRVNLSEHTDFSDLIGSDLPNPEEGGGGKMRFKWSDGVFLSALKRGDWVLLDELNLANQTVLEGLNSILDHRSSVFVPELNQNFQCPVEFRVFGCQNPFAQGGGRKGLPKSFLNRFTKVYVDPLEQIDYQVITRQSFSHLPVTVLDSVIAKNEMLRQKYPLEEFNLRDVFRSCKLMDKYSLDIVSDLLYDNRPGILQGNGHLHHGDIRQVSGGVQFGVNCVLPISSSPSCPQREDFFPQSLQASLIRLARCVQESWPVLLSGRKGYGKTTLIRRLAGMLGKQLRVCQMSSAMDSSELLGCFEQVDELEAKRLVLMDMEQYLFVKLTEELDPRVLDVLQRIQSTIQALLSNCVQFTTEELNAILASGKEYLHSTDFDELLQRWHRVSVAAGGFHWVDGALLQALERGEWLVLDDANLCSPSVLDRLNSVLETEGELMVNEQGMTSQGTMRVIKPHANFRVFLTVDPQFGNVSRAMRNRCVELGLSEPCFGPLSLDRVMYSQQEVERLEHVSPTEFVTAFHSSVLESRLQNCPYRSLPPFGFLPATLGAFDLHGDAFNHNLLAVNRLLLRFQHHPVSDMQMEFTRAIKGEDALDSSMLDDAVLFPHHQPVNVFAIVLPLLERFSNGELSYLKQRYASHEFYTHVLSLVNENSSSAAAWEKFTGIPSRFKFLPQVLEAFDSLHVNDQRCLNLRQDLWRVWDSSNASTILVCWRRFCKHIFSLPPSSTSSVAWTHFVRAVEVFDAHLQKSVKGSSHWKESRTKWPLWKLGGHPVAPTDVASHCAKQTLLEMETKAKQTRSWKQEALAALCVLRFSGSGSGVGSIEKHDALRDSSLSTVLLTSNNSNNNSEDKEVEEPTALEKSGFRIVERVLSLLETRIVHRLHSKHALVTNDCERLIHLSLQTDSVSIEKLAPFKEYLWNKESRVLLHEMLSCAWLQEPLANRSSMIREIHDFTNTSLNSSTKTTALELINWMIHSLEYLPTLSASEQWDLLDELYSSVDMVLKESTRMGLSSALQQLQSCLKERNQLGKAMALLGLIRFQLFVPPLVDPEEKKRIKMDLYRRRRLTLQAQQLAVMTSQMCGAVLLSSSKASLLEIQHQLDQVDELIRALGKVSLERESAFSSYSSSVQEFVSNFANPDRFLVMLDAPPEAFLHFAETLEEFAIKLWKEDRSMLPDLVEPFVGALSLCLRGIRMLISQRKTSRTSLLQQQVISKLMHWPRVDRNVNLGDARELGLDSKRAAKLNTLLVLLAAEDTTIQHRDHLSTCFLQLTQQWRSDREIQEAKRAAKEAQFRILKAKTPEEEHAEEEEIALRKMFPDFHTEFSDTANDEENDGFMMEEVGDGRNKKEEEKEFEALNMDQVEQLVSSFLRLYNNNTKQQREGENRKRVFDQSFEAASLLEPSMLLGDQRLDQAVLASSIYALMGFENTLKQ